ERHLDAFLANLLGDPRRALGPQARGVAAVRALADALRDHGFQTRQEGQGARVGLRLAEAALRAGVTRRPLRIRGDQECIVVAIGLHGHDIQEVSRRFTLRPQTILAAAEERDASLRERRAQRFAIHVAEHQHRAAAGVLDDRGQQPVAFVPREGIDLFEFHGRISIEVWRKYALRSGMCSVPVWNTLAASAPSTFVFANTSAKCSRAPAPPDAISGTLQTRRTAASCSMS